MIIGISGCSFSFSIFPHLFEKHNLDFIIKRKKELFDTKTLRGFVCGSVAGFMQVFVMQPFEIIKVRLVNQSLLRPEYFGIVDCFKRILKEEGINAFYKGTVSPLIGYGLQGSLAFGSNELFKELITYFDRRQNNHQKEVIPMSHILISGILTGVVSTTVLTPADHIRILLQKQTRTLKYKGSIDAGKDVFRRYHLKGLYLGFNVTLLREVLSNAVYFYSYEFIMRLLSKGKSSSQAPIMTAFVAGGLAGSNSWLLTYPVDYIKTVMQSQDLKHLKYRGMMHCAREQYLKQGYRALFKGLGITMLRSFPVNGTAFLSFEYMMRAMGWKQV